MNQLFLMKEYPADVLPMYAQGYSVCRFLIDQKGPRTFIQFLGDYMRHPSWTANIKQHYGYDSLKELQDYWLAWVADGGGPVERFAKSPTNRTGQANGEIASTGGNSGVSNSGVSQASATVAVAGPTPNSTSSTPAGPAARQAEPGKSPSLMELAGPSTPARGVAATGGNLQPEGPATQLASTQGNGWYSRKRREVESRNEAGGALEPIKPMVPPSVLHSGPYQTAHPQPEQQMSRSGSPIPWSSGAEIAPGQFVR